MKQFEMAVLREAFGHGQFGGWHSDPGTRHTAGRAWVHTNRTERVEIEPAAVANYRIVRIMMRDDPADPWTVHARATFLSSLTLILILIAYRLVSRELGLDYQVGWEDGHRRGRASGIRDAREAVNRVQ